MNAYKLSISSVILRFYLMMMIVLVAGFTGMWWVGLLSLPVLLSIMMGVQFTSNKNIIKDAPTALSKSISLKKSNKNLQEVA